MNSTTKKIKVPNMRNEKTSKMPKAFKYYLYALIFAVVLGITIASIKYFVTDKVQRSASVNIEFVYDGAAYNLTPSGDTFSIDAIKNESLISKVLEAHNLSGKYTPEQIIASMELTGLYPEDVLELIKGFDSLYDFSGSRSVSLNDYYPTTYNIKLYDSFDTSISDTDLEKLVEDIAEAYKDFFISEYVYIIDTTAFNEVLILDDYDYFQRIKILKMKINEIKKFSQEMFELDSSFLYNGLSFNDLVLKCNSIENDYISNTEANIITNVITTSEERLRNQYEYEITLLEIEKEYKQNNLKELNDLIDSYQTDSVLYIGSGDSLVKIDSNSKLTYESLVDNKRELSDELIEINSEINRYTMYLEKLGKNTTSSDDFSKNASFVINQINDKVEDILSTFKTMLEEYNSTIISDDSIIINDLKYNGAKLISGSFIVAIIKSTGPIFIIAMCICCIHAALSAISKFRREQFQKTNNA